MDRQDRPLRTAPESPRAPRILIVDDDPLTVRILARMLEGCGQLSFAKDGIDALKHIVEAAPDLILCDGEMPGMSGGALCRRLQADPSLAEIPLIFVTSHRDPAFEVRCFEQGAVDFVPKPVNAPVLLARVRTHLRLRKLNDELRELARVDALTGAATRRVFDETLAHEWLRSVRTATPLSLMLLDVDHFKLFNDHYGHPAGDGCLRAVAQAVRSVARRGTDLVARYGGEEFGFLLPMTPIIGARTVAERVLQQISAAAIPHARSPVAPTVTASIGLCTFDPAASAGLPEETLRPEHLLRVADQALYQAKRGGRNAACSLSFAQPKEQPREQPREAPEAPTLASSPARS
jgi:diguanylate cyclase (GGDEF)-like protein